MEQIANGPDISYIELNRGLRSKLESRPLPLQKSKLLAHFDIGSASKLGSGTFGVVCKAKKKYYKEEDEFDQIFVSEENDKSEYHFQEHFAIKFIPTFSYEAVSNEVECLSSLIHPNIVACFNVWEEKASACGTDEWGTIQEFMTKLKNVNANSVDSSTGSETYDDNNNYLCFQFEFCDGGTLEDILDNRMKPTYSVSTLDLEKENATLFIGILEGLIYLQVHGVVHGDLKPNNIFIVQRNGRIQPCIGDFGLSLLIDKNTPKNIDADAGTAEKLRKLYLAPELISDKLNNLSHKSDIYAFGLIYLQMIASFKTAKQRRLAVVDAMTEGKFPERINPQKLHWIKRMIETNSDSRPTAKELKDIVLQDDNDEVYNKASIVQGAKKSLAISLGLLGLSLSQDKTFYKKGYRYMWNFFYEYLTTLNTYEEGLDDFLLWGVEHLYKMSLELGRDVDAYFSLINLVPILIKTLGPDHIQTLKFEYKLHSVLLTNNRKRFPPHRFIELEKEGFCDSLIEAIINSPTYKALPWTNCFRSSVEENLVTDTIERWPENHPDFKTAMAKSLQVLCKLIEEHSKLESEMHEQMEMQFEEEDSSEEPEAVVSVSMEADNETENSGCLPEEEELAIHQCENEDNPDYAEQYKAMDETFTPELLYQKIFGCKLALAKILERLNETEEARDHFESLLDNVMEIYKGELEKCSLAPSILAEYALFIVKNDNVDRFYTVLIYMLASYQLFEAIHGSVSDSFDLTSSLVFLFQTLNFKTELDKFLKLIVCEKERLNKLLTTAMESEEALRTNLLRDDKVVKELERKMYLPLNAFGNGLQSSSHPNALKINSLKELLENPPQDFPTEWSSEVLEWARKFYVRIDGSGL